MYIFENWKLFLFWAAPCDKTKERGTSRGQGPLSRNRETFANSGWFWSIFTGKKDRRIYPELSAFDWFRSQNPNWTSTDIIIHSQNTGSLIYNRDNIEQRAQVCLNHITPVDRDKSVHSIAESCKSKYITKHIRSSRANKRKWDKKTRWIKQT